ncbi:hypothetical protein PALA111701_23005 [Paenibacillus lactis]
MSIQHKFLIPAKNNAQETSIEKSLTHLLYQTRLNQN